MFKKKNKPIEKSFKDYTKEIATKFEKELEEYKERWLSLASNNLDYIFLKELFDEVVRREPGFTIEITLADGTKLDAFVKNKERGTKKEW